MSNHNKGGKREGSGRKKSTEKIKKAIQLRLKQQYKYDS